MAIKYFKSIIDSNGFVHSVDMLKLYYSCNFDKKIMLDGIRKIAEECKLGSRFYETLDRGPCVRWNYWQNHIHLDYIYIRLGRYVRKKYGDTEREYDTYQVMSVEFNPNKHYDEELTIKLFEFIESHRTDGPAYIDSLDYTIDVPVMIDDVIVLRSRKIPGLYKSTKYFGNRGQNGFVRIYNKTYEADLSYPLTRIETFYKISEKYSSVDFGVIDHNQCNDSIKLSKSAGLMVDMLKELQLLGSDNIDTYLSRMIYHTRKIVTDCLSGTSVRYIHNPDILNQLMAELEEHYNLISNPRKFKEIHLDEDGFMFLDEDDEGILPFEL